MSTYLEINLNNLTHNYNYIKSQLPASTKIMAVVKAFGYGSDASAIALTLQQHGCTYFAVAYSKEGVALRKAGVTAPILVLHPQIENFEQILTYNLEPNLYSKRILNAFFAFAKAKTTANLQVHLKFNTGLNRLGFNPQDITWISEQLATQKTLHVKSIFSHLSASEDDAEKEFTQLQINEFKSLASILSHRLGYRPLLHHSNTSAVFNYPEIHLDVVRSGIGLYGIGNTNCIDQKLKPVHTLRSIISQIHHLKAGQSVGYNRAFITQKNTTTATIPLGHADGISRIYGNGKGWVTIAGKRAPIIGNVCMDMLMVDVTHIDCNEGDHVIIFGHGGATAAQLAEAAGTISYELITSVSQRVKRVIYP